MTPEKLPSRKFAVQAGRDIKLGENKEIKRTVGHERQCSLKKGAVMSKSLSDSVSTVTPEIAKRARYLVERPLLHKNKSSSSLSSPGVGMTPRCIPGEYPRWTRWTHASTPASHRRYHPPRQPCARWGWCHGDVARRTRRPGQRACQLHWQ